MKKEIPRYLIKIPKFFNPIFGNLIKKKFLFFLYSIYNNFVYFSKKFLNLNLYHFYNENIDYTCSLCKKKKIQDCFFAYNLPDFNIRTLKRKLFKKFYFKSIAKCSNCGLLQDYNRPSQDELNSFRVFFNSKDQAVSEEIWHSYPMPNDEIIKIYNKYYKKKFLKWNRALKFITPPKKILFLRPTLGFDIKYFKDNYQNIECYFTEISKISEKTIMQSYNDVKKIKLNIDANYVGDFNKYSNFFDLIVSNHQLVHVYNLKDSLDKISNLLISGGSIIFSQEISVKTRNTFHYNFYDELMFVKILKFFFNKIKRIDDTGYHEWSIVNYTTKKDNPCFFVIK